MGQFKFEAINHGEQFGGNPALRASQIPAEVSHFEARLD
jgi:hypothetical protein